MFLPGSPAVQQNPYITDLLRRYYGILRNCGVSANFDVVRGLEGMGREGRRAGDGEEMGRGRGGDGEGTDRGQGGPMPSQSPPGPFPVPPGPISRSFFPIPYNTDLLRCYYGILRNCGVLHNTMSLRRRAQVCVFLKRVIYIYIYIYIPI